MNHQELKDNLINWVVDDGMSRSQVVNLITQNTPSGISNEDAEMLIDDALYELLEQSEACEPDLIMEVHIAHYEQACRYFKSVNHVAGILKALRQKEKLVGLVSDTNRVMMKKSETVITAADSNEEIYLDNLTAEDRQRLRFLLHKMLEPHGDTSEA